MTINKTANANKPQAPTGFMFDPSSNLIRIENIDDHQLQEDTLVSKLFPRVKTLHQQLLQFKQQVIEEFEAHISDCIKLHGILRYSKIKGNLSLYSFNGRYKVERSIRDKIEVNSTIEAARQHFDIYIKAIEAKADGDIKVLISRAFNSTNGKISTSRLTDLLNAKINHPEFKKAATLLKESLFKCGDVVYYRFYERDDSGNYQAVSLQFSALAIEENKTSNEQTEQEKTTATA